MERYVNLNIQDVRRELAQQHEAEVAMVQGHVGSWLQTTQIVMEELAAVRRDLEAWLQEELVKQEVARLEMRLAKAQRVAKQLEQDHESTETMRLEREIHDLEARLLHTVKDREYKIATQVRPRASGPAILNICGRMAACRPPLREQRHVHRNGVDTAAESGMSRSL